MAKTKSSRDTVIEWVCFVWGRVVGAGVGDVRKVFLEIGVPEGRQTMHRHEIIHMHTSVCAAHTRKEKCARDLEARLRAHSEKAGIQ